MRITISTMLIAMQGWSVSNGHRPFHPVTLYVHNLNTAVVFLWLFFPVSTYGLFLDLFPRRAEPQIIDIPEMLSAMQDTLSWGVKLRTEFHRKYIVNRTRIDRLAENIAKNVNLVNYGQVGELYGHYLFSHKLYPEALNGSLNKDVVHVIQESTETKLQEDEDIEWFHRQWIRKRIKRALDIEDPMYPKQWHLHNKKTPGMDINVTSIWAHNITGEGVVVAVIDDGLEWSNPDILENYCPEGSWDLNAGDADPVPELHENGKTQNRHGTRCAGEIAAVQNNKCGVGVAYGAKVSGIRLLDGPMTDSLEATAFNKFMQTNDIYSCSWGPDDDGKTVDGPHPLAMAALQHGVTTGRRGRGSIFVVASGNGGKNNDNCNFDGYANSMYTITIGAVDENGEMPFYAEECASMLGVTFSSGSRNHRNIVTTDWTLGQGTGCTTGHTGTSAAAPIAAGMIALALQAKPCLSWRDVQHLVVYSSSKVDMEHGDWFQNAAGLYHSHKHGYGLLSAWRLVNAAKVWRSVPWLTSLSSSRLNINQAIPIGLDTPLVLQYKIANSTAQLNEVATLEHVLITVSLSHPNRGKLRLELQCPSGTKSVLATPRSKDRSSDGLKGWTFSTVRCWGEEPSGIWKLFIYDSSLVPEGIFSEWKLTLYGSPMSPDEVALRRDQVFEAMSGDYLDTNLTEPCSFYWNPAMNNEQFLTTKTMRLLLLVSGLITILAAYYTLEQAFCNQEDKDKLKELHESIQEERRKIERQGSTFDSMSEMHTLMDSISMEMVPSAVMSRNDGEDDAEETTIFISEASRVDSDRNRGFTHAELEVHVHSDQRSDDDLIQSIESELDEKQNAAIYLDVKVLNSSENISLIHETGEDRTAHRSDLSFRTPNETDISCISSSSSKQSTSESISSASSSVLSECLYNDASWEDKPLLGQENETWGTTPAVSTQKHFINSESSAINSNRSPRTNFLENKHLPSRSAENLVEESLIERDLNSQDNLEFKETV